MKLPTANFELSIVEAPPERGLQSPCESGRFVLANTRKQRLPLPKGYLPLGLGWGKISPKHSRFESLNRCKSEDQYCQTRGNNVSLSLRERDGVRGKETLQIHRSPKFQVGAHGEGKEDFAKSKRDPRTGKLAFTLLEVMVAIALFFVASFAILGLVSTSLDNMRRLEKPSVDASPVLARYAATNSLVEGTYQGSLGDPELLGKDYRDYNYVLSIDEVRSNHLYNVRCIITSASGHRQVLSDMSTVLYKPHSPPGSLDGGIGLPGH